jgi:hypothetical protein
MRNITSRCPFRLINRMPLRIYDPRVLVIDLRNRRSGFAVFEGPRNLLDFGTTVLPSVLDESVMNRFSDLLRMSLPSIIVVRKDRWENLGSDPASRQGSTFSPCFGLVATEPLILWSNKSQTEHERD